MNVVNGPRISRNRDRQRPTRDIFRIFVPPVGWPYVGGTKLWVEGQNDSVEFRSASIPLVASRFGGGRPARKNPPVSASAEQLIGRRTERPCRASMRFCNDNAIREYQSDHSPIMGSYRDSVCIIPDNKRPHPAQARAAVGVEIEASAPSRSSDADTGGS